ncbi:DUF2950 domain-containing protein [Thiocapsa marina]|uniref:DUF2950 domain-containing protein n=1 Tax=Thiocapsa marina 5811 TaxID=768671 RepID=F9U5M2_9GAMM|nr:DUF2950 domain-containing protein [Thiocapsa marina]EGV20445.1 hypothetical protein ThimaDRAFT_0223 [Thiocapsa marina 5811]
MKKITLLLAVLIAPLPCVAVSAAEDAPPPAEVSDAEVPVQPPMHFETPDAAVMALIDASEAEGRDALYAVLGSDLDELVSGDPVADAADRRSFVELAREEADLEDETEDSAILSIGPNDWPFPIPLAKDDEGWYFDTRAGVEELLDRRVGLNELHAVATARAFVDAQREYAAADPNGDGIGVYASRLWSTDGKRDGLYWPTREGEPDSPMGPLVGEAVDEGYRTGEAGQRPRPYHGYYFRILTAQGPAAPGGARSYLEDGRLVGGFGLVAWPTSYGNSGIMSFQVNQRGIVYEGDLGDDTGGVAASIDAYDPGDGWEPVVD